MKTTKIVVLLAATLSIFATQFAGAISFTIGDPNELGFVNFGIPSGDADRTTYVNHLIGMALGTSDVADGQTYFRSNNSFSPLPAATWAANLGANVDVDLGSSGYQYLFAKYDGPNYGSEVWYVGGLTGIVTIPATGGGYGLSGVTLFTPGASVPDGGMTLFLLGTAITGLGAARRFVTK